MRNPDKIFSGALLVLLACFGWAMVHLFALRFEAGDVYPPYSTLRADPLGTKALYESLEHLPGMSVRRNYQPLAKLRDFAGHTVCYFGLDPWDLMFLGAEDAEDCEAFVAGGGRLVLAFFPIGTGPSAQELKDKERERTGRPKEPNEQDADKDKKAKQKEPEREEPVEPSFQFVSALQRWGFQFGYERLPMNEDGAYQPVTVARQRDDASPETVAWHSSMFFDGLDKTWQVLYARGTNAVVMERKLGAGTIVLSSDAYFLSNEALRKDRAPALLAWVIGPNHDVLFDETHLGISETPGVVWLARKYQLHWLFAGLLLLAGLFVWKNSVSFVPPYTDEADSPNADLAAGKDSAAAMVNLLRRSVAPRDLLGVCVGEWRKSFARGRHGGTRKLERMESVVVNAGGHKPTAKDLTSGYNQISQILKER